MEPDKALLIDLQNLHTANSSTIIHSPQGLRSSTAEKLMPTYYTRGTARNEGVKSQWQEERSS